MAANQYGIDLGEIYRTQAAVEGARTQNKLSGLNLGEMEREIAERPAKEAAATERKNLIAQNIQGALGGDKDALNKLYALDTDTAKTIAERVDTMSKEEKEQSKASRLEMAQMSTWIANAKTPEEAARNFQVVLSKMPTETQEKMTAELESFGGDAKKYAVYSLARVKDIDTIFSNPKVVQVADQDIVYKDGREIERKTRPTKTSTPLVSVNTGSDKKESEKLAELRVKRLDEVQQKAIQAEEQIESINQIKSIDLDTGLGVETKGQIAKVWDSIGGDGKALTGVDPSDVQKFKAVATKQVLDIMSAQKGPQTDQDAKRIENAVASLGNTKEANEFVMDAAISIANRKIEQSEFMERYLEENGSLKGADAEWRDFKIKTPMVSEVVKDPVTGNPVFFYQFREKMKIRNFDDQDIVEAWRRMNAGGK